MTEQTGLLEMEGEEEEVKEEEWVLLGVRFEFQLRKTLTERRRQAEMQLLHHPTKVPVVAEVVAEETAVEKTGGVALLVVPRALAAGQLYWLLRWHLRLAPDRRLFLFVGSYLPRAGDILGCLYDKYKDEDDFLYVACCPKEEMEGPKMMWMRKSSPPARLPSSSPSSACERRSVTDGVAGGGRKRKLSPTPNASRRSPKTH